RCWTDGLRGRQLAISFLGAHLTDRGHVDLNDLGGLQAGIVSGVEEDLDPLFRSRLRIFGIQREGRIKAAQVEVRSHNRADLRMRSLKRFVQSLDAVLGHLAASVVCDSDYQAIFRHWPPSPIGRWDRIRSASAALARSSAPCGPAGSCGS